ncbi:MAG: NAD(P)H-dependent oxidoreductase subunit E [Candidatus Omnitrophota bacterium]
MRDPGSVLEGLRPQALQILERYDEKPAAILTLLHLAAERLGQLTPDAELWVSELTGASAVAVRQTASFYTMYRHPCKRHLRICTGLSCALNGGRELLEYLQSLLAEQAAAGKTPWTVEEAECLCACEKAPMLQVDCENVENLTKQKIEEILKRK